MGGNSRRLEGKNLALLLNQLSEVHLNNEPKGQTFKATTFKVSTNPYCLRMYAITFKYKEASDPSRCMLERLGRAGRSILLKK